MKTRRLATVLTSAYLSAMLATSVAPIGRTILAAPINPAGAQAAFDQAIGRIDAGWVAANAPVPVPVAQAVIFNAPTKDPVMTEELMARIIKFGRALPENRTMAAEICKVFGRCDGKAPLAIKSVVSDTPDHYFSIPADPNIKDIYISVSMNGATNSYLTDKTGVLRAAAVYENRVWRLITNEQGAAGFKAEMDLYAKEATVLPPTNGTAVASTTGNS